MKRTLKPKNRILKHFRFSPEMVLELEKEHLRTRRDRTTILEIAFNRYMSVKADERDKSAAIRFP